MLALLVRDTVAGDVCFCCVALAFVGVFLSLPWFFAGVFFAALFAFAFSLFLAEVFDLFAVFCLDFAVLRADFGVLCVVSVRSVSE